MADFNFRRRRTPDPDRPGTIYRSKPKLGRGRGLSSGPPYLDEDAAGPAGSGRPGSPGAGVSGNAPAGVGSMYENYGGRPVGQYGQLVDDPGYDGPDQYAGSPGSVGSGGAGPRNGFDGRGRTPNGGYGPAYGQGGAGGYGAGGSGGSGASGRSGRLGRPRLHRPRLSLIALIVVVIVIGYPILLGVTAWKHVNRVDAVGPAHQVSDSATGEGTTYLVVGSDSRSDLTTAEKKKLGTGSVGGGRTDTIMLLHTGGGATTLVSIPRDSYVPIPGHGYNKINAAYAFGSAGGRGTAGGAALLIRTVENVTGVRVDQYAETGLEGFANVVDALGGVVLCPKFAMKDHDAHINLKKGCQLMNGATALGYARARHSDPRGDLGRVERQRETLTAIAKKTLSPTTLVQPWKAFPAARAGGGALTIDSGMSPIGLTRFVLAMKSVAGGGGLSMTVPVSNPDLKTPAGDAVKWNSAQALQLFKALRTNNTTELKALAKAQKS